MKKTISLKKQIEFPSMIGEITDISLEDTLKFIDESNISGDFIVSGSYKQTEASVLEEKFKYVIPTEIILNERLSIDNATISVKDFYYEIESDYILTCNIEVEICGLEIIETLTKEKEENEQEESKTTEENEQEEKPLMIEQEPNIIEESPTILNKKEESLEEQNKEECLEDEPKQISIFDNIENVKETYSTYSVYNIQEESLTTVLEKYNTTREELEKYNDLSNIVPGSKLIIPNYK